MSDYYTYTLAYTNGNVFYVGKGQGNRMFAHIEEALNEGATLKCAIIRQIWSQGGQVLISKVYETDNENDAYLYEWALINLVHGRENLANLSEGGRGWGRRTTPNGQDYETATVITSKFKPPVTGLAHKKGGRVIDPRYHTLYTYQDFTAA